MRMYAAFLVALLAMAFWPDENMFHVPFAALTLKLIFTSLFVAWLGYISLVFAFGSLQKDRFWPWKWNKEIGKILAIRWGVFLFFVFCVGILQAGWPKFDDLTSEYPIISILICFAVVTFCICADDKEFLPDEEPVPVRVDFPD